MRIGWARAVVPLFILGAVLSPVLGASPQYKDVCASGCTYSSVQAAIDSITDSSATNVYTVFVDSGVLQSDNSITTNGKDYINFVGRGMGVSVLQASPTWYSRAAALQTGASFFDFTDSTNVVVSNLTIDARSTDPGNVSTSVALYGAKVDPGSGGKIVFDGSEVQGIYAAMWDDGPLADGLVELFGSKLRGVQYGGYVSNDKWHIFSSDLRAVDSGGSSWTVTAVTALLVVTGEATVWGSHLHAESAQPNKTYYVNGLSVSVTGSVTVNVIGSTSHVKMTTTSIASSNRIMAGASITKGTANFTGTEFLYENTGGALSQGRMAGLQLGGSGTINLAGCTFRDAGGSGGTSRSDLVSPNSTSTVQLHVAGTRITSAVNATGSTLPPSVVKGISAIASQRGSATFTGSNTVPVTLPVALPDTNYTVGLSGSASETVWVSNKTTSGFTLNSSNATSTATVDWLVTGCSFGSTNCGF